VARYRGGGRLCQFDVDGYHKSTDIEKDRLEEIAITGPHPLAPFILPVPPGRPPDEVVLKVQVDVNMELGATKIRDRVVEFFFGYAYLVNGQRHEFFLHIDREGKVSQEKKGF
jgi:hypothetical protein